MLIWSLKKRSNLNKVIMYITLELPQAVSRLKLPQINFQLNILFISTSNHFAIQALDEFKVTQINYP